MTSAAIVTLEQEQEELSGEVDVATQELARLDLCGFWSARSKDVLKWARRLQKFPYSAIPFVKKVGAFLEALTPKIDAICQVL